MMTTDKPAGVLYCIPPCCLICGRSIINEFSPDDRNAYCSSEDEDNGAEHCCDDFTLRDFGHPVRTVEAVDANFDGFRCNYNRANAGTCVHNNTLCLECFGPETCEYLAMKKLDGVE